MIRKILLTLAFAFILGTAWAQMPGSEARAITKDEYELAKDFEVDDLNNDTYVKFDNTYILDRYEMRKPIYVTGDDGLRKRFDLYKLIAKEGFKELGTFIFYTNEKDDLYKVVLPSYVSDGEVWEQYFEDIHAIDKEEKNFVLKLSYVLSREFSFQSFKNLKGGEIAEDEHATYGTDICFPGDQMVTLADGSSKPMNTIKTGDEVISIDPISKRSSIKKVSKLISHTPANYAITKLTLLSNVRTEKETGTELYISVKELKATPNHPMLTNSGKKEIGNIKIGELVLSLDKKTGKYIEYEVVETSEIMEGSQPVYSIEAEEGETLLVNGVMVRQKQ